MFAVPSNSENGEVTSEEEKVGRTFPDNDYGVSTGYLPETSLASETFITNKPIESELPRPQSLTKEECYDILGVDEYTSLEGIRNAYQKKSIVASLSGNYE